MRIEKRDGSLEHFRIEKIEKQLKDAVNGFNYDYSSIEQEILNSVRDKMSSEDIQKILIQSALNKTDVDAPNWSFVASKLFLNDLYHKIGKKFDSIKGKPYSHTLKEYIEYGVQIKKIIPDLADGYDLEELNSYLKPERDRQFTFMGIRTLYDRYLIRDEDNTPFELPQHLFMGVSMYLAKDEVEKMVWVKKYYDIISKFEVMVATPTLSNARTNHNQLSSCFVGVASDNIESIFDGYKDTAILSKFGGGIGWDFSEIRGEGSPIRGVAGASGGLIPFLKPLNDVAVAVDQLGSRRASINTYIQIWHWDLDDFIDLKKNSGEERRRTHDLFTTLWIPDLFMERVQNGGKWTLLDPYECRDLIEKSGDKFKTAYLEYEKSNRIRKKSVSAREVWKKILLTKYETGVPFLAWKDESNRRNQNSHVGNIRSSNLCLEIFQNTSPADYSVEENFISENVKQNAGNTAVCNLASINLSKINSKEDFERVAPIAVRMLDSVIDANYYPIESAKFSNLSYRPIGLGVMGEAQFLAENSLHFGTPEHYEKIDEVMEQMSYNTILASVELGQEKGIYPNFNGSNWSNGILPIDTINENVKNLTSRKPVCDWDSLREKAKNGIRNGYLIAVAPTSSISILSGTSQAIEPIYKRKWSEENLSGMFPVTAPNLNVDTWHYYKNAYEVEQLDIIRAGAVRQKWIDQGQSLNIFVNPDEITGGKLHQIYMLAWKLGLKSTYYIRSKSPEVIDRDDECLACQ
jgi:ribonucleoside-diphosphate reductase alpha chain